MSFGDHKSRRVGPSFLRGENSEFPSLQHRSGCSVRPAFARVSMEWVLQGWARGWHAKATSFNADHEAFVFPFLPCSSGHTLRATSGALRHIAALLSGLLSQSQFGPLSRMRGSALGSRAPCSGFANG
jgi:hypothetical protein